MAEKTKNDSMIQELLAKVEIQKKALGTKPRGTWITNGVFKFSSSDFININIVTDFSRLGAALGFLLVQEEAFDKGCKSLGIDGTFKWDGYTRKEWEEDFRMRVSIIRYDANKKKLEAAQAKLNSLISEDARTAMELEDLKNLIG